MDIITGYLGEPHVTAEQDRDVNIGVVGDGSYVMPAGQRLAAEVQTNNEVRIRDGVLIHQGCAASIKKNTYDTVTIANGSQGMKRIDLIVARYQRNVETGVESLDLVALQGTPSESDPTVPEHTEGDIQAGDAVADMPLYEVEKDGLNITRVTKVFEEVESLSSLNGKSKVEEYTATAWDDHTVYFYKIGQIVICVNIAASQMPQANINASYCGIPTECIPITNAYTSINEWDGSQFASEASASVVSGSNVIRYRTSATENRERNFTLVWLTS